MLTGLEIKRLHKLDEDPAFHSLCKYHLGQNVDMQLTVLNDGTRVFIPMFPATPDEELDLSDYDDTLVRIVSGH